MAKTEKDIAQLFHELDEIVNWFEREEIDLDESIKKFERGMEVSTTLKEQLSAAKNRVETIKKKFESS